MKAINILYIISILIPLQSLDAKSLFTPPPDMHRIDISTPSNSSSAKIEKYTTNDKLIQVTIFTYSAAKSASDVTNFTASLVSGMKKKSFIQESESLTTHSGLQGALIKGRFPLGEENGAFLSESYLLFGSKHTYVLNYNHHDSLPTAPAGPDILGRFSISDSPTAFTNRESSKHKPDGEFAEKIGYYGVFILLGIFIVAAIRKRATKSKA
jgi:hypothetical protein